LGRPNSSCCRDKVNKVASRRAGAFFFARHLDYFIMTRNFAAIYRDLLPFRKLYRYKKLSSFYQDWQKTRHRDADGT
jgi:hypothetical protein